MQIKYIAAASIALLASIGWNVFLIQRDAELFKSQHDRACAQVKSFHPDCQATP